MHLATVRLFIYINKYKKQTRAKQNKKLKLSTFEKYSNCQVVGPVISAQKKHDPLLFCIYCVQFLS